MQNLELQTDSERILVMWSIEIVHLMIPTRRQETAVLTMSSIVELLRSSNEMSRACKTLAYGKVLSRSGICPESGMNHSGLPFAFLNFLLSHLQVIESRHAKNTY